MGDGHRESPVRFAHQFGECRFDLPESVGIGLRVRPPRMDGGVGQVLGTVAEDFGECRVDLDDGTLLVADEKRLLQRVHQRGAPAGVIVAQARQLDVGAHPGEQLRGGEWFDQVVVGAGQQTFDRGVLARARGQQQDG